MLLDAISLLVKNTNNGAKDRDSETIMVEVVVSLLLRWKGHGTVDEIKKYYRLVKQVSLNFRRA